VAAIYFLQLRVRTGESGLRSEGLAGVVQLESPRGGSLAALGRGATLQGRVQLRYRRLVEAADCCGCVCRAWPRGEQRGDQLL